MMRKSCRRDFSLGRRGRWCDAQSQGGDCHGGKIQGAHNDDDDGVAHRVHFEHSLLHDSVTTILIVKFSSSRVSSCASSVGWCLCIQWWSNPYSAISASL